MKKLTKKLGLSTLALASVFALAIPTATQTTQETNTISTYDTSFVSPITNITETFTNGSTTYDYDAVITLDATYYDDTSLEIFTTLTTLSFLFPIVVINDAAYYSSTTINNIDTFTPIVSTNSTDKTITISIDDLSYDTNYIFDFAFIIDLTITPFALDTTITIGEINNVLVVNNPSPDTNTNGLLVATIVLSITTGLLLLIVLYGAFKTSKTKAISEVRYEF